VWLCKNHYIFLTNDCTTPHIKQCMCSPCYGSFSSHLTHKSCFVQMLFSTGIKIIRKHSVHSSVTFLRN
jgi:hypothetical protein